MVFATEALTDDDYDRRLWAVLRETCDPYGHDWSGEPLLRRVID